MIGGGDVSYLAGGRQQSVGPKGGTPGKIWEREADSRQMLGEQPGEQS